jgi:hypothetical protein
MRHYEQTIAMLEEVGRELASKRIEFFKKNRPTSPAEG